VRSVSWTRAALLTLLASTLALAGIDVTFASLTSRAESAGSIVTAAKDFRAPAVTAVVMGKTTGGATGFVKQGGAYFVYANVSADTGKPASGIATVTANVANLTAGSTAVVLAAGSYAAPGGPFGYRSASLTADPVLAEGSREVTVTATDNALNAAALAGSVEIDNTAPVAAGVQTTNAGTSGLIEQGDTLTLSFSEPVEPQSILAGWSGAATNVVVRVNDNGLLGLPLGNDALQIYNTGNVTLLPLGAVDLGRGDYVAGALGGHIRFGASGTPSTMSLSGNAITVTLGTYATPGLFEAFRTTASATGTMSWTPVATPYDRAGNNAATTAAAESGAADKEF
jgi:hypothetical protein